LNSVGLQPFSIKVARKNKNMPYSLKNTFEKNSCATSKINNIVSSNARRMARPLISS